jgi:hypothetical protein
MPSFGLSVFAEEERGHLPRGQLLREALDERREPDDPRIVARGETATDGAERIHRDERGSEVRDFGDDALEDGVEILGCGFPTQIDELDDRRNSGGVEKRVLLLIPHHLHRRLAEDGEVDRAMLRGRVGEQHLLHQRRFACARRAGNEIERIFAEPTAEHCVETGDAGQDIPDHRRGRHEGGAPPKAGGGAAS